MLLNSTRDTTIKRYLSKVGECYFLAKSNESRYYLVKYSDTLKIKVRFSNHFKVNNHNNSQIDIIKTTESTYFIKTDTGISISLYEADIMPYLRSLFLLFPEISKSSSNFKDNLDKATKNIDKLSKKISSLNMYIKREEEKFQLGDEIWDKNKELLRKINDLQNQVNLLSSAKNQVNNNLNLLKAKLNNVEGEKSKLINKNTKLSKNNKELTTEINILRKYYEKKEIIKESFKDRTTKLIKTLFSSLRLFII